MSNIESLMAHRIEKSQELIARVLPLIGAFTRAAWEGEFPEPRHVLSDSLLWTGQLIAARTVLDQSAVNLALVGAVEDAGPDIERLVTLRQELAALIDAVSHLTSTILENRAALR